MKTCMICNEDLSERARSSLCPACQSSFSYWKKKRPAHVLKRRAQLYKYSTRMAHWFDVKGNQEGVTNAKAPKKRRANNRPSDASLN